MSITETIQIRYNFSDAELLELSREMARAASGKARLEDDLAMTQKSMKADIAAHQAIINAKAEKVRNGYEMRSVVCDVVYGDGVANYIDKGTGQIVKERPMTYQEQLRIA